MNINARTGNNEKSTQKPYSISKLMLLSFLIRKNNYRAKKLVCFSADEMYNIVSDVRNYESFIPFCKKSTVFEKTYDDGVSTEWSACLEIGFPPVTENFTSTIIANKPHLVQAYCKDGKLFEYLETTWIFREVPKGNPNSCIIDFSVSFQFRSVFYAHLASIFLNNWVNNIEDAFIQEARRRYGRYNDPVFEIKEDDEINGFI